MSFGCSNLFGQTMFQPTCTPRPTSRIIYIYGAAPKNEPIELLTYFPQAFVLGISGIHWSACRFHFCSFPFFRPKKHNTNGVLDEATESPVATAWDDGWLSSSLSRSEFDPIKDLKASAKQGAKHTSGLVWWLDRERFEASSKVSKQNLSLFLHQCFRRHVGRQRRCAAGTANLRGVTPKTPRQSAGLGLGWVKFISISIERVSMSHGIGILFLNGGLIRLNFRCNLWSILRMGAFLLLIW